MIGDVFNLIAAILCTLGAAVTAVALFLSEPTFVNLIATSGALIGTLGGIAWIVASCNHLAAAAAMTRHDYLVLGMAALWLVTNGLGAAFTIRRLQDRRKQYEGAIVSTSLVSHSYKGDAAK